MSGLAIMVWISPWSLSSDHSLIDNKSIRSCCVCVCVCYVSFECSSVLWRTLVFRTHSRAWNPVNAFWAISRLHRQVKDVQHDVNESTNCGTRSDVVTSNAVMSGTHWHTESCRSTPRHCTRVYSATSRTVSTSQEESGEPYLEVGFPERESR